MSTRVLPEPAGASTTRGMRRGGHGGPLGVVEPLEERLGIHRRPTLRWRRWWMCRWSASRSWWPTPSTRSPTTCGGWWTTWPWWCARARDGSSLLGLYDGVPLTERDAGYGGMVMPDRITIFRRPILAHVRRRGGGGARRCASPSSTRWPTTSASTTTGSTSSAGREALRFRRAVLVEAAERGRGRRPRPPPALGVLRQVGRCSSWRARRSASASWPWDGTTASTLGVLPALLVLVALGWVGLTYLKWVTTNFVITTDRLIYRHGVLVEARHRDPARAREHRVLLPVDPRADGRLRRPRDRVGRRDGPPELLQRAQAVGGAERDPQADGSEREPQVRPRQPRRPARGAESIPEQIAQLDELRQQGALTQAEFDAKKQELLDRM